MEETESTPFTSLENSDSPSSSSSPSPPLPPPPPPLNAAPLVTNMMAINMRQQQQQQQQQNIGKSNLSVIVTSVGSSNFDLLRNKGSKRGRPRKYDSDGNLSLSYKKSIESSQSQQSAVNLLKSPPGFVLSPHSVGQNGRSFGNRNSLASLGELFAITAGGDFTPQVLTVRKGEDVASKILSFPQKGPRGLCVLSANGAVSNVTIRQPGSSGGILTYEGLFEILSLTGSFTIVDNSGVKNRTGGLSVSLAGSDGRVIGGAIAGLLTACSPIQVVIGTFMLNGNNTHRRKLKRDSPTASNIPSASDTTMTTTATEKPILTRVTPDSETTQTPTYVPQQGRTNIHEEPDNNENKHMLNFSSPNSASWNALSLKSTHRPSPDINLSVSMSAPVE